MQENKSPYQVGDLVKLRDPPTDHPDQKFLKSIVTGKQYTYMLPC